MSMLQEVDSNLVSANEMIYDGDAVVGTNYKLTAIVAGHGVKQCLCHGQLRCCLQNKPNILNSRSHITCVSLKDV